MPVAILQAALCGYCGVVEELEPGGLRHGVLIVIRAPARVRPGEQARVLTVQGLADDQSAVLGGVRRKLLSSAKLRVITGRRIMNRSETRIRLHVTRLSRFRAVL